MALGQGQSAAQGSHSSASSPQAVVRPILQPIDSAHHALKEYQFSCNIESVWYYPDDEYTRCAVVLDVGFLLSFTPGEDFKRAKFPTRVLKKGLDRFPEVDEVVDMSEYTVNNQSTFAPAAQAAGVGVSVGAISRQTQRTLHGRLHLRPQKPSHDEIWWHFINDKSDYFPSSVKLLLVVQGPEKSPRFSFELEVLPTLKLRVKRKWWHPWTTKIQPPAGVHDGWSCKIEENLCSKIAEDFLAEYQKPREDRKHSRMVGLHGAVISYLEESKIRK